MSAYTIEPLRSNFRVEKPRVEYTISAHNDFEIPESQRRELHARLTHYKVNPNEHKCSLSEVMADRLRLVR